MVGRQAELAALTSAGRRAVDGHGSVAVIVGAPGIGKTHVLESFADAASDFGLAVHAASAYELEHRRPFGVLLDALGIRPGAADSWRARIAARLDPTVAGPDAAGFWIGEELLALIDELCAQAPVALVVDDVQWVDPASLALLARMGRMAPQQRLLIVLSVRPPPRPADVTRLITGVAASGGRELTLGPLNEDEIAELVAGDVGAPPGASLWPLLRRTGGSPLFVRELVAGLRADGALRIEGDRVEAAASRIPESLAVAVRHRLAQLDAGTTDVLRLAAVIGGPFTLAQLGHVTARRPVELYAAVGAALEAGVLREDGNRLQFTHDVIRTTLYDDIPHVVRVGLHRDIASALADSGAPPLDVAEHYLRGAAPGDREAVDGLRRAATATAGQSPAAAADLLERAAALLSSSDPELVGLALERARHLASAGRAADAESVCRDLLPVVGGTDAERALRRTLMAALLAQSRMREALEECRQIAAGTVPGTTAWARATATLSYALLSANDVAGSEATASHLIGEGGVEDATARYTAHMTLAMACRLRARASAGLDHLDQADVVARSAPRWVSAQNPSDVWRSLMLLDLDRLDEALATAHRGRTAAEETGVSTALANSQSATASALYARGDIDDAVAEYRAHMQLSEELGTGWRLSCYGALTSAAIRADDLAAAAEWVAAAEAYLRRTGEQPQLPLFLRAKAELLEAQGRPAEAVAVLASGWRSLLAADIVGSVPFFGPDAARLAVAEDDLEFAASMAKAATNAAERLRTPTAEAAALRAQGYLDGGLDPFVAATEVVADSPRPLARAAAHEDAGLALARAGHADDARRHLTAAIDFYEQLGAARDVARVSAAGRAVGLRRGQRGQRRRPTHGWESLTDTERRVADLVASGLSNPVIAERMYLSRRTVQTHVSHILAKTGHTSRVELATAMARRGG